MAQPNLSQQLKRIEQRFSAPIFHRDSAGVQPTEYGTEILRRAAEILDQIDVLADVRPVSVLRNHYFDLDISAIVGGVQMPTRPVWESTPVEPSDGVRAVLKGSADIFVGVQWPHTPWPDYLGLASVNLFSHDLEVLVREDHPLVGRGAGRVTLDELRCERWVARSALSTTEFECGRFGFRPQIHVADDADERRDLLQRGAVTFFNPRGRVPSGFRTLRYTGASPVHHLMHYHLNRLAWSEANAIVSAVQSWGTTVGDADLIAA